MTQTMWRGTPDERELVQSAADGTVLRYYTRNPAPTQWVAVGQVTRVSAGARSLPGWLVVGNGRTEDDAVRDLKARLAARAGTREPALAPVS